MARKIKFMSALIVSFVAMFAAAPMMQASAAEATGGSNSKSGFGANLSNAISDFQSSLPSIFHEPNPGDVGNKPRLRPHFYTSTGFTSDANLGTSQDDPAWIARVSPGLTLELPIGERLYTELDYTYSFATVQGRDTNDNTNSHNLSALARYALTEATELGLKHSIQWSQLPGTSGDMFTLNYTTAEVKHEFSDILDAYLSDTFQWFQDETENDEGLINQEFIDNGIAGGLNYDVTERLTLTPNARWNIRDFSAIEGKDYWQVRYAMAARYELGAQTILYGHFGHNIRKFDEGSDRTQHDLIWGVGITNNVTRKLSWNLDYAHNVTDTFDTDFVNTDTTEATNQDNLDRNFRQVTTDRIRGEINYILTERNHFGFFTDVQFTNADAQDNVVRLRDGDEITLELGPIYSFRLNQYVNFDVKYTFGRRVRSEDSGGGRGDYTFHRASAGLNFAV